MQGRFEHHWMHYNLKSMHNRVYYYNQLFSEKAELLYTLFAVQQTARALVTL